MRMWPVQHGLQHQRKEVPHEAQIVVIMAVVALFHTLANLFVIIGTICTLVVRTVHARVGAAFCHVAIRDKAHMTSSDVVRLIMAPQPLEVRSAACERS